jgi:hypothetical protein
MKAAGGVAPAGWTFDATDSSTSGEGSPASVQETAFPVAPGGTMPPVEGCEKKDYAVIFVIGVAVV